MGGGGGGGGGAGAYAGMGAGLSQGISGLVLGLGGANKDVPTVLPRNWIDETKIGMGAIGTALPYQIQYLQEYAPQFSAVESERLGQTADAYRSQYPGMHKLAEQMTDTASRDMAAGSRLNPSQQRQMRNYVRSNQSAQGFGYGPSDTYQETLELMGYGDQLKQQRFGNARDTVAMNRELANNPWMDRTRADMPSMDPFNNPYLNDFHNTSYNAAMSERMRAQDYNRALEAGGWAMMGESFETFAGAAGGMGG